MKTLTVTINLLKLLNLQDVEGVQIDVCETVDGNVDIILTGEEEKVTSLARSFSGV